MHSGCVASRRCMRRGERLLQISPVCHIAARVLGVRDKKVRITVRRYQRAGMRWTVAGANGIIALRCCIRGGRFEDSRERRPANGA